MSDEASLQIEIGSRRFTARMEATRAPVSVAFLTALLPLRLDLLHVRWSGEAMWAPFRSEAGLLPENNSCYPRPGQILIYAGVLSEPELLIAYGPTAFASKAGPLSGNHVATLVEGADALEAIGREILWRGAQPLVLTLEGTRTT
jgi:hypothetical protein